MTIICDQIVEIKIWHESPQTASKSDHWKEILTIDGVDKFINRIFFQSIKLSQKLHFSMKLMFFLS
jgi:hypothetical protein